MFNQHAVLTHTLIGLLYVVPASYYFARHLQAYWQYPLTHIKFSGYLSLGMTVPCIVSGVVLTVKASATP